MNTDESILILRLALRAKYAGDNMPFMELARSIRAFLEEIDDEEFVIAASCGAPAPLYNQVYSGYPINVHFEPINSSQLDDVALPPEDPIGCQSASKIDDRRADMHDDDEEIKSVADAPKPKPVKTPKTKPTLKVKRSRTTTKPTPKPPTFRKSKLSAPAVKTPKKADENSQAIEEFLKNNDVRRFENTATGDPWFIKLELVNRGHKVEVSGSISIGNGSKTKKTCRLDGKICCFNDLLDLLDLYRAEDGLPPQQRAVPA